MTRESLAMLDHPAEALSTHARPLPVLIQVPALPPSKRFTATSKSRPRPQPRRRIRREVKMLAAGLVLGLGSNWMVRWSGDAWTRPDRVEPVVERPEIASEESLGLPALAPLEAVNIELERPVPEVSAETLVPVAFPGYLLPDDGYEEANDEGG